MKTGVLLRCFIFYPCVSVWFVSESESLSNCLSLCLCVSLFECISGCLYLSVFVCLLESTVDIRVWRTRLYALDRESRSDTYTPNFGQGAQWFYFAEGKVNR